MNFRRLRSGLGLVAFILAASAGAGVAQVNPNAPPPPPLPNATFAPANTTIVTPAPAVPAPQATFEPPAASAATPVPGTIPTPAPAAIGSPSPGPRRGHKAAPTTTPSPEPSDTPEPPQFTTLDGIWEIELQPVGRRLATYEHFFIVQKGSALSGYWEHTPKKIRVPITGNFDGRLIQIQSAIPDGGTVTFSGYVENMADMVGVQHLTPNDGGTAFTAQHRKKEGGKL